MYSERERECVCVCEKNSEGRRREAGRERKRERESEVTHLKVVLCLNQCEVEVVRVGKGEVWVVTGVRWEEVRGERWEGWTVVRWQHGPSPSVVDLDL